MPITFNVLKPNGGFLRHVSAVLAAATAALFVSCAPAVLLSPEAADLRPAVEAAVPRGTRVLVEGQGAAAKTAPRNVVRITSTPGWNLTAGVGPAEALPRDWAAQARYAIPKAFEALVRRSDGSWSAVPLLFDVWGKTAFVKDLSGPPPSGDWGELRSKAAPASISVAGSRPSFRQSAYFFEAYADDPPNVDAADWFSRARNGWKDPASVLPALIGSRSWNRNAWLYTRDDQAMLYKAGKPIVFLETYRDYELANPPGMRRFVPLSVRRGQTYAMAGPVLFAEFRGSRGALKRAARILKSLSEPLFQREASVSGKWLALSGEAPELDADGAAARRLVRGCDRFFPLTDRLPDPLVESSLFVDIQLALERVPRK